MSKAIERARDMVSATPPSPAVVQTLSSAALLAKLSCRKALGTLTGQATSPGAKLSYEDLQRRWREWAMLQRCAESADAEQVQSGSRLNFCSVYLLICVLHSVCRRSCPRPWSLHVIR